MPSIITSPRVGSMSRARQRTSDDLPLPDSPITTNVSPRPTSKEMSRTPTVWPVAAWISARVAPPWASSMAGSGSPCPNTFHTPRTLIIGVSSWGADAAGATGATAPVLAAAFVIVALPARHRSDDSTAPLRPGDVRASACRGARPARH